MADGADESKRRNSYRHEFKLKVINCFYDNRENIAHAAVRFKVDRKQVRNWVRDELKIRSKQKLQKVRSGRTAAYPNAEKALLDKFVKMREGRSTEGWWFNSRIT